MESATLPTPHHLYKNQSKSNYFIVRLKVDQRAGLPHLGITTTEKIELKHKTNEQISPVNGLEPRDQSDRPETDQGGG